MSTRRRRHGGPGHAAVGSPAPMLARPPRRLAKAIASLAWAPALLVVIPTAGVLVAAPLWFLATRARFFYTAASVAVACLLVVRLIRSKRSGHHA